MNAAAEETARSNDARWARIPRAYRAGGLIIAIALLMATAFALSYSLALGRPAARHIPIGVVGDSVRTARLLDSMQSTANEGLQIQHYPSLAAAESAVDQQQISGILDGSGPQPRLLVSSASGPSVARVLQQIVADGPRQESVQLADLHPLPATDPQGLTTFYVVIAATVLGFVTMFQLRANIDGISLRGWLGLVAALAVMGGALLAVVSDPALGALHGSFLEIWSLLSAQCAVAALFNSSMLVLIGRWAILPTWGLFIVLGNASSGGAVASSLLPAPYAWLSRFLPTGATVSGLHSAVYFPHHQHLEPFVVLGVWLVVCALALMCSSRLRHRTPAD